MHVHIVLSSLGFWGEELVAPLQEFEKAGITHDISTPYGNPPAVVDVSMDPSYVDPPLHERVTTPEMAAQVRELVESDRLSTFRAVEAVSPDEFDALLLVGGSGPILDMINCRPLHSLIQRTYKAGKLIAAECYAVGTLAFTRDPDDPRHSIIWGRRVTGHPIPYDYTTAYGYAGVSSAHPFIGPPIALEYLMSDAVGPLGEFIPNLDKRISVVLDYPFLTSRSVAESRDCGLQIVTTLSALAHA